MLSAADFYEVVVDDIRGQATVEQSDWLRQPEQLNDWHDTLADIARSLNHQFLAIKEDQELDAVLLDDGVLNARVARENRHERTAKKRRMTRFRQSLDARLSESRRLKRQANVNLKNTEDHTMRYLYREAIKKHRAAVLADDYEPTEHDIDLWDVLAVWAEEVPDPLVSANNGATR